MGAATAAAVPSSTTRAGLNPMIFSANNTVMPAAATAGHGEVRQPDPVAGCRERGLEPHPQCGK